MSRSKSMSSDLKIKNRTGKLVLQNIVDHENKDAGILVTNDKDGCLPTIIKNQQELILFISSTIFKSETDE